jgi:hypothetical protein
MVENYFAGYLGGGPQWGTLDRGWFNRVRRKLDQMETNLTTMRIVVRALPDDNAWAGADQVADYLYFELRRAFWVTDANYNALKRMKVLFHEITHAALQGPDERTHYGDMREVGDTPHNYTNPRQPERDQLLINPDTWGWFLALWP